tara:strand:+ start:111 stop:308 length:198 start_codon:yes stop_codon:yes gene_type:complete
MIYWLLILIVFNTALIFYCYKKQSEVNMKIIQALEADTKEVKAVSNENKKHIDDMLKMREMYESD